ncbi:MAG: hypothetical protein WC285_05315, partial [Candidatus Gracilibacteria bacterium]
MAEKDDTTRTKYFRTLIKSGHTGSLVESGSSEPLVDVPAADESVSGDTSAVSKDVRMKALGLLGLIEEYFVRPESEGGRLTRVQGSHNEYELVESDEDGEFARKMALRDERDLELLLKTLEDGGKSGGEAVTVKDSIKQQIRLLLGDKEVKEYFFGLLSQETKYFQSAKPTLKRVAILKRLRDKITSEITKIYLRDKRNKGKLMATTAETIKSLEGKRTQADEEERTLVARADVQTQSWLHVQELLEYKQQLKETGFARTESRKKLTERVLSDIAHGNKVFL